MITKLIKSKEGEDIYSLCNRGYNTLDQFIPLCLDNKIDPDIDVYNGNNIIINTEAKATLNIAKKNISIISSIEISESPYQSLYDICLMGYGSLDRFVKMIMDNPSKVTELNSSFIR